jgi:hypothetical protein
LEINERLEKVKNENIKKIIGVNGKPDITDIIQKKDCNGMAKLSGCQSRE